MRYCESDIKGNAFNKQPTKEHKICENMGSSNKMTNKETNHAQPEISTIYRPWLSHGTVKIKQKTQIRLTVYFIFLSARESSENWHRSRWNEMKVSKNAISNERYIEDFCASDYTKPTKWSARRCCGWLLIVYGAFNDHRHFNFQIPSTHIPHSPRHSWFQCKRLTETVWDKCLNYQNQRDPAPPKKNKSSTHWFSAVPSERVFRRFRHVNSKWTASKHQTLVRLHEFAVCEVILCCHFTGTRNKMTVCCEAAFATFEMPWYWRKQ